jgi:hypothetical protein
MQSETAKQSIAKPKATSKIIHKFVIKFHENTPAAGQGLKIKPGHFIIFHGFFSLLSACQEAVSETGKIQSE